MEDPLMREVSDPSLRANQLLRESVVSLCGRASLYFAASPIVAFLIVLAVGASFRFFTLGLVRHSYDDSYPIYDALRILDGHKLLLTGQPSSVFLDNPPLMSYLQAIPLLVWRSPWAVYIFITVLNTIAIWFVYRAAQQLLGDAAGLLSAFLFAINPWVVYFSRTTWVQALIPFFTALIAWGLWPTIVTERRSPSRVLAASLAVTAMTQTYIQAWGVLVQTGPLVILFRRRIPRRSLYAGISIFALALTLYGVGLSEGWETNRTKLLGFLSKGEFHLTRDGLDHAVRLVTGRDFEYVYAQGETGEYNLRRTSSLTAHYLLGAALITGVTRAVIELRRGSRDRRTAVVLLVWFAVPIVLASISAYSVHPHYLLLSCPAGYMLAAWGISPLLHRKWLCRIVIFVLLVIAILFGFNLHRASEEVASSPTRPEFDGWALEAGAQVGAAVRDLSKGNGYPIRICAKGGETLLSSLSGTYVATLKEVDFPNYVVLPGEEPLLYVLVNTVPEPEALGPLHESFPEHNILLTDGTRVSFLRALPYSRDSALALPEVILDWPSEAGLSMLGYSLKAVVRPGQLIHCTTYWRVEELHPGREEWYIDAFYHLLDQAGRIITNVGGHGQWGYRWQLGDVYVDRVSIPVPADLAPGEYRVEMGLFDCIHTRNYPLRSPDGPTYAVVAPVTVEKVD
jgi:4-amino-4-deoxy-L-arabinose transferase-like glycosyltransferase